jgi:hypothetical protein
VKLVKKLRFIWHPRVNFLFGFYIRSFLRLFFFVQKGPALEATDAPQPSALLCNPCDEDEEKGDQFCHFFK